MRFAISSIILVAVTFILFVIYAVMSFILWALEDELTPLANNLDATSRAMFLNEISQIQLAFGVCFVLLFAITIVVFIVDNLRTEPDSYTKWRYEK